VGSPTHVIYGLRVRVEEPMPGLAVAPDDQAAPDVDVALLGTDESPCFGHLSWQATGVLGHTDPWLQKFTARTSKGVFVRLLAQSPFDKAHVRFVISPGGRRVWCNWTPSAEWADIAGVLVKSVLGRVLRLQGRLALHASAVSIGGKAFLILGRQGAGMSTMAAGFRRLGHAVMADDLAALSWTAAGFLVYPGCPELRLRADAAAAYGEPHLMAPLWVTPPPWVDKTRLVLRAPFFERQPRPLAAMVFLQPMPNGVPVLRPLTPQDAMLALVQHVYGGDVLDKTGRSREFQQAGRLVTSVPCWQLQRPDDLTRLPATVKQLTGHVAHLGGHSRDDG
jgi:hypothetical protein